MDDPIERVHKVLRMMLARELDQDRRKAPLKPSESRGGLIENPTEPRENIMAINPTDPQATELERVRTEVLDNLARLGQIQTGDDALVYEGTRFVLPTSMSGQSLSVAVDYLRQYERQMEAEFSFTRNFNYRPWDGANAFQRAMKRVFGTTGVGKTIPGNFFSPDRKPEYRTVANSANTTLQVPWGAVSFTPLEATFYLGATKSRELGLLFQINVEAPRRYRAHIDAFLQVVQDELDNNSIYRGQAFTGGDEPVFLDTSDIDPRRVVYTDDVMIQLTTNLWSVLRYTENMRAAGVPLKRSVLVEGPYGTGKTLAGQLTAREAVNNGWTFIINRAGKDDLADTLKTAQLYAPSVVWFEDIDIVAAGKDEEQVSKLLDSLDSITNKGVAVVAGFTTNHVDKIQKGVLRPGRLDAVIHIGALDDAAMEKLIRATLPADLTGNIDFATVVKAFAGFLPAFAKEATDRAIRYSLVRGSGDPLPVETDDLVNAARGLRPQLALMEEANEGVHRDSLAEEFQRLVRQGVDKVSVVDTDDDEVAYRLSNGTK
jgi:ATPase family associated with various cellular activities (AAA)